MSVQHFVNMISMRLVFLSSLLFFRQLAEARLLARPSTPAWWDTIQATYEGDDLSSCKQLDGVPPVSGSSCRGKARTCFFGDQQCDGEPHPDETCTCENKVWSCSAVSCPPGPNSCPLVINNPEACPAANPLSSSEVCTDASLIGATCHYGSESW